MMITKDSDEKPHASVLVRLCTSNNLVEQRRQAVIFLLSIVLGLGKCLPLSP